ncbi:MULTISPECIES: transporter substrate-binding domain-containing protein [unclassified Planococcus (in: firmicutes)]|uniref:transporter substrate-binding domain-containing protein n=1 Tax=unclassified Planococcus (in: firmicutes) TaxID=2662419 RepID=UPI000C34195B|nr:MULTISPECIES: transporter substrate-binding domain-containing protein [unclassified Planococcus (in: firmicutes)]MDE4085472.1 transporter substrate-binding domain-containing protein [Planococcus maritimus]AUD14841.1 ABC transporter substrate-binding protein [Planococcus sp. MB-3u-03]PKG45162.1 ABC transporter substrate-binding protein [Planococcus sp. Urea-trap-24]PKG87504.1 ABC transporter substrate-binding protein [Planococcus sp. Urea-3u-39]PKH42629.1 ABC transporter substrate-binding pr
MNKKFTTAGVILTAGMLLAACGSDDSTTGSEGSSEGAAGSDLNLLEEGQFTTASSGLYKPFSFEEGGELKGFDIDIGNAIAEEMGLEPSPVTTPFETIIQGLNSNRFDAIIGSMSKTAERAEQVSFSDPYYYSGGAIFVREGTTDIQSVDDLADKKIGVVGQTTYDTVAQEHTDDIQYYSSDVVALQDLEIEGRLDAVITADVVGFEAQNEGLAVEMVGDPLWVEQPSIAVRKDDEELLAAVNEALDTIIENGTYDEISQKWFGRNLLDIDLEGVEVLE